MTKTFEGKVVLVTGANSGIGETAAVALRRRARRCSALARRKEALEAARARHPRIHWVLADVANAGAGQRGGRQRASREAGRLDVLVNNAAIFAFAPLEQSTEEMVRSQFEINVFGLTFVTQAALPALKASRGTIVNISSAAGHKAGPGRLALRRDQGRGRVAHAVVGARAGAARRPRERDRAGPDRDAGLRQARPAAGGVAGGEGRVREAGAARAHGEHRRGRPLDRRDRRARASRG